MVSFMTEAKNSAPKYITRVQTRPTARKKKKVTSKILWVWLRRPETLASEIILDTATGTPAVEIISRILNTLKAAVKSA